MSGAVAAEFLQAGVRTATPLAYAALGELVVERAGVINIGLEGAIIAGAFGAAVVAGGSGAEAGLAGAVLAGTFVAVVFAFFVVTLRADQIITGTAISWLGLGLTGALSRSLHGGAGAPLHAPLMGAVAIPGLASIPFVGRALFDQPPVTYVLYVLVPALAWWFYRTVAGLALRAVGEHPEAAQGAGISPSRVRWVAILFGGAMGGVAGGTLVLAQVGTFTEGMSAGRGFIAIAIVVLGRWTPFGVAAAALVFGGASALQTIAQATGWHIPYQLPLAFPYLLTLALLASARARSAAPAALGQQSN